MANDISDLVVRARPEGLDETSDGFGQMQSDLEDTEEQMEETTGGLEVLGTRWSGAMNAIVAGLAVGTGGLLTQVPVVGEAMGGLGSVIDALAFKMDQTLRPAIGPLTDEFYDLSNEIYKSDGVLEGLEAVGNKIGDIGSATIDVAVEENVAEVAAADLLTFVFPELGKSDIISAVFSFDIGNTAILTAIFGSGAIATSKLLGYVFGVGVTAPQILAFVFASLTVGKILSVMFDGVNMTEGAIIAAAFGGIAITAGAILSMPTWPIIAAGGIVAAISWPILKADQIIEELLPGGRGELADAYQERFRDGTTAPISRDPRLEGMEQPEDAFSLGDDGMLPSDFSINMDGRDVSNQTGQYRFDETASRGRFP